MSTQKGWTLQTCDLRAKIQVNIVDRKMPCIRKTSVNAADSGPREDRYGVVVSRRERSPIVNSANLYLAFLGCK